MLDSEVFLIIRGTKSFGFVLISLMYDLRNWTGDKRTLVYLLVKKLSWVVNERHKKLGEQEYDQTEL